MRELAEQADPFIKDRLLQLAAWYERRVGQPEEQIEIALTCPRAGRPSDRRDFTDGVYQDDQGPRSR
ncbi:hypothetical protein H8A95_29550 [Bradyrhizobium sp. Pear76]|uniref:hypothetical protein n=1 Tax=Bradyrhizobium oropedii TaxID=1571201 RepID=UPI001E5BF9A9|nr:hypothetical protein [Bradyrhizobium oropedii]MCC8966356.1 hypothetical protein [Bradyrhizobium oropedii]